MSDNRALGVLSWLTMIGDTHNRLTTVEFLTKLRLALQGGHLQLLSRQEKPVAWLIWRRPSPSQWHELLTAVGDMQTDRQMLKGQVWLDFWVRPFGCDVHLAQKLRQSLLAEGLVRPRLCWHDPSVKDGEGQLHLNIPIENLPGM